MQLRGVAGRGAGASRGWRATVPRASAAPARPSVWEQSRHAWVALPDGLQHFRQGRGSGPTK